MNMKSSALVAAAIAVSLTASMCGVAIAQDVSFNMDPNTNFAKYKTYIWVQIGDGNNVDQLTDQAIKTAIDSTLRTKGFTRIVADSADVFVGYQTSVDKQEQIDSYGGVGWGGMASATTSTINVGTLAIDLYDPAQKKLVWRSTGTQALDTTTDPKKMAYKLQKATDKMMKSYPAQPKPNSKKK